MPNFYPRTDLAAERKRADLSLPGIKEEKRSLYRITEERLTVEGREAAESIEKPEGVYTTLSFPSLSELSEEERDILTRRIGDILSETLLRLTGKRTEELSLLIVGLGNRRMTADAIGCMTAEKINATAHLKSGMPKLFQSLGAASIAILIPGVLPQSGMEAADRTAACVAALHPDAVIAFDALFARSLKRIGRTVQIADSGIEPGGGIGNARKALTQGTLGVPVISVGVPTVTDTRTLVGDTLSSLPEALYEDCLTYLEETEGSFVSCGDCDRIAEELSSLLAEAVNTSVGVCL